MTKLLVADADAAPMNEGDEVVRQSSGEAWRIKMPPWKSGVGFAEIELATQEKPYERPF